MERDQEDAEWARKIKSFYHHECQICGAENVYLESHHLNCYSKYPEERLDLSNGTCLCKRCHDRFHAIYHKEHTTKFQFEQFRKTAEIFKKILSSEATDTTSKVEKEE